ncbi:family 43 glycosylhydrolase [Rhodopirellula sallentina]|uniref:Sulfatase and glycosyl hydrolase family 43 domain protein n=1 Tax=Rhodopirellula sallentina SM41 TaxID=1263870 RepID=M5UM50_9BACT|nr:family 43 glycosylhydrolase [Rhodopirellula sallentina]EMI57088.1 sulfatase and glycosyl hydrolase family 43 domain protein [Rhodopirellula sallentina SM41]
MIVSLRQYRDAVAERRSPLRHLYPCCMRHIALLFLLLLVSSFAMAYDSPGGTSPNQESPRPNFLFIAIDDLNDFAGYAAEEPGNFLQVIYPDDEVRAEVCKRLTPNLDRLARTSAPFTRAYCPSALCGPSRTSLMTGVSPVRSGYYSHKTHFRPYDTLKDAITLPQQLKNNGYFTTGLGKLFHKPVGTVDGPLKDDWADAKHSWSQWVNHVSGCNAARPSRFSPPNGGNMVFGPSRLNLMQSGDWMTADFAGRLLEHGTAKIKEGGKRGKDGPDSATLPADQPFFLGCGIFRPHLPFHAPQAFFDLFPVQQMTGLNRASLDAIISDLDDLPSGAERFTDFTSGKMKVVMDHARKLGGTEAEIPAWREMTQSYLACVAYADACLGRILDGYEKSPQRDNTVLFLWSDHGYHLGAKYHVAKQALWEEANRVQFIVHDPRKPGSCDGKLRRQIVSLNDLYPTICDLAHCEVGPQVEVGKSIVSIINDAAADPVHDQLLMTYMEGNHSIRTATHKLNRFKDGSLALYDMVRDPSQLRNLAGDDSVQAIEEDLATRLTAAVGPAEAAAPAKKADAVQRETQKKRRANKQRNVDRVDDKAAKQAQRNPLRVDGHDFYAADPSVVIADDGRLFLFPTTDNRDWEKQFGWSCYSTTDLTNWENHGVIFSNKDSKWGTHKAWAPDVIKKDGKYYFFYYFNNGGKGGVGVAVADQPEGPFKELTKEKLCRGHDPAVFTDDDGRYWMYLQDTVYELGDDMASFKSGPTNLNLEYRPKKFEAAYVFKRNGIYYFTIARGWNNLIYYTGTSPTGPFKFRGEFMKPYGGNNHHSIVQYKDRWILFYHEWVKDAPVHQRRLRAEYLNFNDDGTIQIVEPTDAGVSKIDLSTLGHLGNSKRKRGSVSTSASSLTRRITNGNVFDVAAHNRAFQILDEKVRDPFIERGPDGTFYLTGTTAGSHWGDTVGIRLWKSANLIDWEDMGFVWTLHEDGRKQHSWHFERPAKADAKNGRAVWAPEIHYLNGTWWIPHSVNVAGHGLLKSTSGKPEGPYTALPVVAEHGIDAHLFQEGSQTFYLWGADNLVRLSGDLESTVGDVSHLHPAGKHELGYEGILLKKIGGKYLLVASARYGYESSDTYDLYYCVSDSLYGPYGPRRMAVKNAGHGNMFQDNQGQWWCTAFDHEFVASDNRWTPWIVPIDIVESDNGAVDIQVVDSRFRPTRADQQEVKQLSASGVPTGRRGKKPWDR